MQPNTGLFAQTSHTSIHLPTILTPPPNILSAPPQSYRKKQAIMEPQRGKSTVLSQNLWKTDYKEQHLIYFSKSSNTTVWNTTLQRRSCIEKCYLNKSIQVSTHYAVLAWGCYIIICFKLIDSIMCKQHFDVVKVELT